MLHDTIAEDVYLVQNTNFITFALWVTGTIQDPAFFFSSLGAGWFPIRHSQRRIHCAKLKDPTSNLFGRPTLKSDYQ